MCNYEDEYKQTQCSGDQNTICMTRTKNIEECSDQIGTVRGKVSVQAPDSCKPCDLPESNLYFGLDLHLFTSHGQIYNDPTSCRIVCRKGSYANPSALKLGCKSCENQGNYLFKNMQQTEELLPDGGQIYTDCGFTCKEPFAVLTQDRTDCIRGAMKGGNDTFFSLDLDLSGYEKTIEGFKFTIAYTHNGRYMILVSKSNLECGPYNETADCCSGAFRISHRSFSGLSPDDDICGKNPNIINADTATESPLAFTIRYEFLNEIADCESSDLTVNADL